MDTTENTLGFEKIYEANSFWIGRIGDVEYEAFYLIVSDQRAVARLIAIKITKDDVKRIIDSHGDLEIVDSLARDLSNGYFYV